MQSLKKAFVIFSMWASSALLFHYFVTINYAENCSIKETNFINEGPKIQLNPSVFISYKTDTLIKFKNGFTITKNDSTVTSISKIESLKDTLTSLLTTNYEKEIHIFGLFSEEEINALLVNNLGVNRANQVKSELVQLGINSKQIKIFGKPLDFQFNEQMQAINGVRFKLVDRSQKIIDSIEHKLTARYLRPDFNSINWKNDVILKEYSNYLQHYVRKNPGKSIILRGHSAKVGSTDTNLKIGLQNALLLKEYLIEQNVGTIDNIYIYTKGPFSPIVPNDTDENRNINTRIEIVIK
ncbi:OmpA family protein [Lutibacter sp.]|uniref:OmpA family protein n=1 Tax=Lutibacter sp. TaxID=1925666 RepID=UPI002736ABF8|nr:OmpA family protein [Lutibacter sp.]MDP3312115.1 hypothetical protein [Lutibacter sp.]